jgi:hypothetical protein
MSALKKNRRCLTETSINHSLAQTYKLRTEPSQSPSLISQMSHSKLMSGLVGSNSSKNCSFQQPHNIRIALTNKLQQRSAQKG